MIKDLTLQFKIFNDCIKYKIRYPKRDVLKILREANMLVETELALRKLAKKKRVNSRTLNDRKE